MFTLLVPSAPRELHRVVDPEDHGISEAEARLAAAVPTLSEAAGDEVIGVVGSHDPFAAVQDAVNLLGFDEVIVCRGACRGGCVSTCPTKSARSGCQSPR